MSKQNILHASAMAALCALAAISLQAKAQDQAGQDGMVVVRDAQSGKMRAPTPDELKALRGAAPPAAALGVNKAQPQALSARSGARGVRLGEKTMVYEVVTRGADGKLTGECVHGDASQALDPGHAPDPAHAAHKESVHESR
jgi:hypothetical protein